MPHVSPKALLDDMHAFVADTLESYRPWYSLVCPRDAHQEYVILQVAEFRSGRLSLSGLLQKLTPPPGYPRPALSALLKTAHSYCEKVLQSHPELLFSCVESYRSADTRAVVEALKVLHPKQQANFFRWTTVEIQRNTLIRSLRFQPESFPLLLERACAIEQSEPEAPAGGLVSDLLTHSMIYGHRTNAPLLVYAIHYRSEHVPVILEAIQGRPEAEAILTQALLSNSTEIPPGNALWHAARELPALLPQMLMLLPASTREKSVCETFGKIPEGAHFEDLDACTEALPLLQKLSEDRPLRAFERQQFLPPPAAAVAGCSTQAVVTPGFQ